MKKIFALVLALVVAMSLTTMAWGVVTEVATADELLNATKAGVAEVKLTADIILPAGQHVPVVADLVVDGNGHSITFTPGTGLFNNLNGVYGPGPEGITDNLTVMNLTMISATGGGHAVVTKNGVSDFAVSFTNCRFENLYCGVMLNGNVNPDPAAVVAPTATISGSAFEDTEYGVSFVTEDCVDDVSFENNTMTGETSIQEVFTNPAYVTAPTVKVSSGSFSTDVSDYLDDGYVLDNGVVKNDISGAETSYDNLYLKGTDQGDVITTYTVDLGYVEPNAPEYNTDGSLKTEGNIAYFVTDAVAFSGKYVAVGSLAEADVVVYKDAAGTNVYMYLDEVEQVTYVGNGAPYVDFGTACGQIAKTAPCYDKKATYYTWNGILYRVAKVTENGDRGVMVNGKVVDVVTCGTVADLMTKHVALTTYKDGVITAIECKNCGMDAVKAANFMSIPKGAQNVYDNVAQTYWYFPSSVAAGGSVSTDVKVESAETFDAGIALYVGMSVMAATGAVVLKKRED